MRRVMALRLRRIADLVPVGRLCFSVVLCAFAVPAAVPAPAVAQSAIHGIVLSTGSRSPVEGARVALRSGGDDVHATVTDRNGFYQIGGIRPGIYSFEVRHFAFVTDLRSLEVSEDRQINIDVQLVASPVEVEGVTVSTGEGAAIRDFGRQRIRPGDIRLAPVPAGSGDLATYLQMLPGVTTTGDRGGQLFVRGGTPAENLVLVDGIPIYQPFHILGFFSVFPESLVSTVDFHAGAFGARYRGRTSSVLDVALRDGDLTTFRGSGSVSPFVGEVLIQGPAREGVSWLVSARKSLIEETSRAVMGSRQPISFESQLVKVTASDGEDVRCSALALRTLDRGRIDPDDDASHVSWKNLIAGGRCVASLNRVLQLVEATFSYSALETEAVSRGSSAFRSKIWRMQHDLHTTSMIAGLPIHSGVQAYVELTDYDLREIYGMHVEDGDVLSLNGYVEAAVLLGNLEIRPGVVLTGAPQPWVEPRFRAAWHPFGRSSEVITGGIGVHRQEIAGISDPRDVGSVFTAWVETPDREPIEALHGSLGWQQVVGAGLTWSLEGYYKRVRNLPVPVWRSTAQFTTRLGAADGESYGSDLRLEYRSPALHFLLGYGYGEIVYLASQQDFASWFGEPVQKYHPPHDRRHQLNVAAAGKIAGFDLSARWQLGSGLPFSRPLGFDEAFDFTRVPGHVSEGIGSTRMILDRPFNARLPAMHRLDIAAGRDFVLPRGKMTVEAGLVNAYDRRNMFYYDLFSGRRVDQLPLAPFVSVSASLP